METTKTRTLLKNPKKVQQNIYDFFLNLQMWAGLKRKKDLANKLGVHPTIFSQYVSRFEKIPFETYKKILLTFPDLPQNLRYDLDILANTAEISSEFGKPSTGYTLKPVQYQTNEVPVNYSDETVDVEYITSKVNAGNGYVEMNFPVTIKISKFLIKKNHPEDIFAVSAQGDSMSRRGITDGTMLIVKKSAQPEDCIGQIVVCICDAEFLVKKLVQNEKGDLELHSESYSDYPPIELKHRAFRIFGYVIHSINDY